jgi:multiple sugar transport system permease protein
VKRVRQASSWRPKPGQALNQGAIVGLTLVVAAVVLFPVLWMIGAAIRPVGEILVYPPNVLPQDPTIRFMAKILGDAKYQRFFVNSVVVALATLLLTTTIGLSAAYGFSRFRLPGGRAILLGILALLMLPRVTLIVPYFRLAKSLGIYDSLLALIVANTAFLLPMSIWLLKGYLDSIPIELEEAALIDGCTRIQTLRKVLLPLAIPGMIGVGTFIFIGAWNEYLLAAVLTDTPSSQTLPIGLAAFFGEYFRDWNSIMALSTLTSIPLMLIFVFFQRWVVQGMTSGAVK